MSNAEFVDFYEVLEISPNASEATVERVFRYLAKKNHPDASPNADVAAFSRLVEAFEMLRDPESRAAYDVAYERQQQANAEIVDGANSAGDDCLDRYRVLTVLYAQRRKNFKKPGIGIGTLEGLVPFPPEVLQFHLWYFREKGWIGREECGQLSINASGVDYIESVNQSKTNNQLKMEQRPSRLPSPIAS